MSLSNDVINLSININGNDAQNKLNELRKNAVDLTEGMKSLKKNTQEYADSANQLKTVKAEMEGLKNEIGLTALSMKELTSKRNQLTTLITSATPLSDDMKKYDAELQTVIARQNELKVSVASFQKVQQDTTIVNGGLATSFERIFARVGEYLSAFAIYETVKNFLTGVVEETNKAELASRQLLNTLQNAGRVDLFETLSKQAEDFATAYQAINPEDIKNVFTKLIDYGKLTQTQITSLTDVIVNYAAKQGISLSESTDTFTKALEGNARGLKTYGINIKDAATYGDRLNLILGPMADKVKGAEAAFESTNSGALQIFKERFVKIKIALGEFVTELFAAKQAADTVFDEAKQKNEDYKNSLDPLLEKYDQLKNKTVLNKDEETELHGIIGKIVEILPSAASAFDKYGVALDINRGKITSFLEENKKFLAEKEFSAVNDLAQNNIETLKRINAAQADLSSGKTTTFQGGGGTGGGGGTVVTKASTPEEDAKKLSYLRTLQEKLITDAGTLTDKYGKTLPAAVQTAVDAISKEFSAIQGVTAKDTSIIGGGVENTIGLIQKLKDAIKSLNEQLPKLDSKAAINKNLAQTKNFQDQLDKLENKPNTAYDAVIKEAQAFYKKLQELKFGAEQASKSDEQKDIDAVKHKYADILVQYDALQKKLSKQDQGILGPRSDIGADEQKELDALIAKQKQAAFEKSQKQQQENLTKEYDAKKQQETLFYEGQKEVQSKRFTDGEIDYKTFQANLAAIDVKSNAALLQNAEDFAKQKVTINGKIVTAVDEAEKDRTAFQKAEFDKRIANAVRAELAQQAEIKLLRDLDNQATLAKANSKVIIAGASNDLQGENDAQKKLLDLQRDQKKKALDIQAADAKKSLQETGTARGIQEILIDGDIAAKKNEADDDYAKGVQDADNKLYQSRIQAAEAFANTSLSLATSLNSALNNIEDRKLQKVIDRNNKEKAALQTQLDHKLISQKQYDKKVAILDAAADAEKLKISIQQAKRQKALDIFEAITGTAAAVVGALGSKPYGPWNIALAALVGTLGAVQIGVIASEPLPTATAAQGNWFTTGDKHSDPSGGIPVMIERDEAVVKAKAMTDKNNYTVSGTPAQITSKLNSMHGGVNWAGGGSLQPKFREPAPQINPRMSRIMAEGGLGSGIIDNIKNENSSFQKLQILKLDELITEVRNQKEKLHAVVSIKEYREKEKQYDNAKKAAGMGG